MRTISRDRGERGTSIVLFALVLVVLLIFSAFAVDLGAARQQKRRVQTGADGGALGGIQDLRVPTTAISEAKQLVASNLGLSTSDINWQACATPPAPSYSRWSGSETCIAWNTAQSQFRVEVHPTQAYNTTFARVIGIRTISLSATAEAKLVTLGMGGVLPFSLAGTAGSGYGCIKAGSTGPADDTTQCDNPLNPGNFGFVDFTWYGNSDYSTSPSCTGNGLSRLDTNVAEGIDHALSRYAAGAQPYGLTPVMDDCNYFASPNTVGVRPGNIGNTFECGMVKGTKTSNCNVQDSGPGRLGRLYPGSGFPQVTLSSGRKADNKPLWEFIRSGVTYDKVPDACQRSQFDAALNKTSGVLPALTEAYLFPMATKVRMRKMLQRCFSLYETGTWTDGAFTEARTPLACPTIAPAPCTGVLFDSPGSVSPREVWDIQKSARFAYVPQAAVSDDIHGNAQVVHMVRFRPIFLQRLFGNCTGQGNCGLDFEPGVGDSGSNKDSDGVTAFVFDGNMLPGKLGDPEAPFLVGTNKTIQLIN